MSLAAWDDAGTGVGDFAQAAGETLQRRHLIAGHGGDALRQRRLGRRGQRLLRGHTAHRLFQGLAARQRGRRLGRRKAPRRGASRGSRLRRPRLRGGRGAPGFGGGAGQRHVMARVGFAADVEFQGLGRYLLAGPKGSRSATRRRWRGPRAGWWGQRGRQAPGPPLRGVSPTRRANPRVACRRTTDKIGSV